jgi:hypothetical protein
MLRSESLPSKIKRLTRGGFLSLCLAGTLLVPVCSAFGQDFTVTAAPFNPFAVAPGEDSASNVTIGTLNGFNGTVDLACTITSQTTGTPPTCQVSPPSVKPPGGASVTVTSSAATTPALYTIAVTGTASAETSQSSLQNLTVLAVSPQFTITVGSAVVPTSVPAGSGGQGIININPINGYNSGTGGVTLSCSSIAPLVTIPPVCSFNPQPVVVSGTLATSTITISSFGPVTTGSAVQKRTFFALWLPLPMLALVGLGAAAGGKQARKAWGLLALFVVSGSLLLMPACANNNPSTSTPNGITPANSYTFTVTGVDANGNSSSNTGTTTNPTVNMTVTAPATNP